MGASLNRTDLVQEDVAAISYEVRLDDSRDVGPIRRPGLGVLRVVRSQGPVRTRGKPQRVSACICLRIDVGTRPNDHVHPQLLGQLHYGGEVVRSRLEIKSALGRLMVSPVVVD